jgi:hypothetical protein
MRHPIYFFILLFTGITNIQAHSLEDYLVPPPQQLETKSIPALAPSSIKTVQKVLDIPEQYELISSLTLLDMVNHLPIEFHWNLDTVNLSPQSYTLEIAKQQVLIKAYDRQSLFYALQTLRQLFTYALSEKSSLPTLFIKDFPNFKRRGYMLDISRDKVPTMESLFQLIDFLASWKINELQLYTEHTFAYKNHSVVWKDASPLTAEEIRELDDYCQKKYIDLVPNQNSFGHMENWLKHDEYLDLAECPEDCDTKWGKRKRTSLTPSNPASLSLMQELYAELLPNFSSPYCNIGGDETIELCEGRSKKMCDQLGKGQVYLNYLKQLNTSVNNNGKQAQFWGDIILNHPELINEIPKNMTALVWGYDASYPFDKNLVDFQKAGLDFYVCPGTSTWRSEIGKNHNAFINLKNAAVEGKHFGAKGFLTTNWGDYGHWQPLAVTYPSMLLGASYAWNYQEKSTKRLPLQLSNYVYLDASAYFAQAILKLGNAYLKANIPEGNANAFHLMLRRYQWTMEGNYQTRKLNDEGLLAAEKEIKEALLLLDQAQSQANDSHILYEETRQAATLALHGIHLGLARLKAKNKATKNIDALSKQKLITELEALIEKHRELWLVRNRPGGLSDSVAKLEDLLNYYKAQ